MANPTCDTTTNQMLNYLKVRDDREAVAFLSTDQGRLLEGEEYPQRILDMNWSWDACRRRPIEGQNTCILYIGVEHING